ncbi:hypothetical protein, partial [Kitasatospora sp. NPDC058190]|uniref:hypothetical protein n=1 Tax=Kitasatospora sp. NPDC058190 TaxID=3346371 RepID=UPI0036DB027E
NPFFFFAWGAVFFLSHTAPDAGRPERNRPLRAHRAFGVPPDGSSDAASDMPSDASFGASEVLLKYRGCGGPGRPSLIESVREPSTVNDH